MMNIDYTGIVAKARTKQATSVNFNNTNPVKPIAPISGQQDTVTLSKQAVALINGDNATTKETAHTYVKPETARSLLAQSNTTSSENVDKSAKDSRFDKIMQRILDQHTGVDREKIDEINEKIKEIESNKNMSPEEKYKAIEILEQKKEKIIEESIDLHKIVKQTNKPKEYI